MYHCVRLNINHKEESFLSIPYEREAGITYDKGYYIAFDNNCLIPFRRRLPRPWIIMARTDSSSMVGGGTITGIEREMSTFGIF